MYEISKKFEFDYGHRVWTQSLLPEFSLDSECACKHFHGHRGVVEVHLTGDLNPQGMVTDFKHLNWFKKFLDNALDHKMVLDYNDPALQHFFPLLDKENLVNNFYYQYMNPDTYNNESDHIKQVYAGLILTPFVPTSENLAKWLHEVVETKMIDFNVTVKISFNETPKSKSIYEKR